MGADTKGRLNSQYKVKDIQRALKHKFNIDSTINETYAKDYYLLLFNHNKVRRALSIFENYIDDNNPNPSTLISLGANNSSVELIRGILELYGGELTTNDCSDEWEYVSPSNKIHLTEEEALEDKLFSRLNETDLNYTTKKAVVDYVKINLDFIKSL